MSKSAVITGASSGIGLELAKLFAKDKYDLVIIARNEIKLKEIAVNFSERFGVKVIPLAIDLSVTENAFEVYKEIKNHFPGNIDVLINNAGFGGIGKFSETDLNTEIDMMNLNVNSLVILTKLFLKDMINSNSGKILNVASTAAFQPGPYMSVYYASKAFVLSFSEAIAEESRGTNISISVLCPGPTKTEFQKSAGIGEVKLFNRKDGSVMTAEEVAVSGYKGLFKGKRVIIPGFINKAGVILVKFLPRRLVTVFIKHLHNNK